MDVGVFLLSELFDYFLNTLIETFFLSWGGHGAIATNESGFWVIPSEFIQKSKVIFFIG